MATIHALAAREKKGRLEPFSYDPGDLGDNQVEIEVQYCGVCHSDLIFWENAFGLTKFPLVPGHEAIGKITAVGRDAKFVEPGQTVGLGWNSASCLHCRYCLAGDHNLCNNLEQTIVGRHGAFATRVRCHWVWASPIPAGVDLAKAGPLLCGGITVFNPFVQFNIRPTDRVGIVGIGGLGHMALQFANKWGCEVTAFTTSAAKAEEAKKMGTHHVLDTNSRDDVRKAAGSFDLILSTVEQTLDMSIYLRALAKKGRYHVVGLNPEIRTNAVAIALEQKEISGSPSGAPGTVLTMLDFCARHGIAPIVEEFPMTQANEAMAHLAAGKARYRVVLENDLQ